jgi:hypothetical protein
MTEPTGEPPAVQFSLIWPGVDELEVRAINQHLVQIGQDAGGFPEELIVTLGHLTPPVLLGTPDEQRATLSALGVVAVHPVVRVSLTRARALELIGSLTMAMRQWDAAQSNAQQAQAQAPGQAQATPEWPSDLPTWPEERGTQG